MAHVRATVMLDTISNMFISRLSGRLSGENRMFAQSIGVFTHTCLHFLIGFKHQIVLGSPRIKF
jgi:hypothetical protein